MNCEPLQETKVQTVLQLFAEGKSREEVGEYFSQSWKTVATYMYRKGFVWDKDENNFVEKSLKLQELQESENHKLQNTKASQIIRMLETQTDFQLVALKHGFQTIDDMGTYMKNNGYQWDDEIANYRYNPKFVQEQLEEEAIQETQIVSGISPTELQLLQFLMQHKEQLEQLLVGADHRIQTYKFKGNKVNKTLTLASSAVALLEDYRQEYNLTQRSIIETALAEFFQRHGYQNQLKMVTS